jgi:predicted regulator of Ras-like GTPase activity (Roadblock/LC7/MglB family)
MSTIIGRDRLEGDQTLTALLARLHEDSPDIEASMIISRDGLMLAAHGTASAVEQVCATFSGLFVSGARAAGEIGHEELREVVLRSNRGFVVITGAGPVAILVTVARNESNLGLVILDARQAAQPIAAAI